MKLILTIAFLFVATLSSYSQSSGYHDLALLFSKNDQSGSARFTSMSGAFGALGGDISAINVNPAGLSIFSNSEFSATINSRNTYITSTYYQNSLDRENQFFNLSQAGVVFVSNKKYNSDWSKFAVGLNYRITKDFNNHYVAKGNSGYATFDEYPSDPKPRIKYDNATEQIFKNGYVGNITEVNLAFSSIYQKKLYIGVGINFYDLKFIQPSTLRELNENANGDMLDALIHQENNTIGTGFSLDVGAIYKITSKFRVGVAYKTPNWYGELLERSNIINKDGYPGDTSIIINNNPPGYDNYHNDQTQQQTYNLKTPSKLTLSAAVIFGKQGLLSIDYINRNYKNIRLSNGDFAADENLFFKNQLRNTNSLNIGTEWRFDHLSIRGGYRFEQSPDELAITSDNLQGYSLGGGYKFGNFKIDLSYSDHSNTGIYNFYPQVDSVKPAELNFNNKVLTATFTLEL